ncbi:glycosyltransferase family 2 protein [Rathayibacter sp. AY1E2]|uniref:glycosyltransferase family 2 protein n=1 Tax=Rathayibacter sp. AY1E2 TaxID=2080550 RepID=UPI000CE8C68A|nr:glycosyltransferase family 2 protein [Rathayibacter sp. AY1E2]PPH52167.1 hypothetical protein C5C49_10100 [Rathayibacter sp. AY1E2]
MSLTTRDVTTVVPTLGRPALARALQSVRGQTGAGGRTVVVLDDPSRENHVRSLLEDEVLLVTAGRTGGANARSTGARAAETSYVAFLDDDDWWEPEKLARQVKALSESSADLCYTATYFHESGDGVRRLPTRELAAGQSVASYLVARPSLKHGTGYIQTSSLLASRRLLDEHPWDPSMKKHQDWDLVARWAAADARMTYVPLALVHVQQGSAASISKTADWRASAAWLARHGDALDSRAYGDFVATQMLRGALSARDPRGVAASVAELSRRRPHVAAMIVGLHGLVEK